MEGVKVDAKVCPEGSKGVAFLVAACRLLAVIGKAVTFTGSCGPAILEVLEEVLHGDDTVVCLDCRHEKVLVERDQVDGRRVWWVRHKGRHHEGPVQGLGKGQGPKEVVHLVANSSHAQTEHQIAILIPHRSTFGGDRAWGIRRLHL